jgi:thiol:disulfide interchange protein
MPAPERDGSTRRVPLVLLVLAGALLVARIGTGVWERRHPPEAVEHMHWRTLAEGVAEARATGRPLLYDFTAAWCAPCRMLNRDVFSDAHAARQLESQFVPVRVMDRAREDGRNPAWVDSLQRTFRITGFPMLVAVSVGGGEPVVLDGYGGDKQGELQALFRAAAQVRAQQASRPRWIIGDTLPLR